MSPASNGSPTEDSADEADDGAAVPAASRRRVLSMAALGAAGLAGCSTETAPDDSPEPDGTDVPTVGTDEGADGDGLEHDLESWDAYNPDWEAPTTSPLETPLETEVLVENLEIPWDIAFAPDGNMFITERVGRVVEFDGEEVRTVAEPADAIDAGALDPGSDRSTWWVEGGEGGTLGIAVHPNYPEPPHIYVYYTYEAGGGKYNRVDVFDVTADDPGSPVDTIVEGIPGENYHDGGRITFGPANYLWICTGDGGDFTTPQDVSSLGGKILRVDAGGNPAPGNPDLGDDADPRVFSYGHRNPQGIVWLPDGTPINSEHGPQGRDELNRLEPGGNYGWGTEEERIRNRDEYPGSDVHKPLFNTGGTSLAPTGSLFYTGEAVPSLQNRILTGSLIGQRLLITTLTPPDGEAPPADDAWGQSAEEWSDDAYTATVHATFQDELGRIRHVEQGPDGEIYLITSNRDGRASEGFPRDVDDVLLRLRPA